MKALVTGVSRGIGRSICLKLAQDALARGKQPHIFLAATGKSDDLQNVKAELEGMGVSASAMACDLSDPEVPVKLVEAAVEFCGGLDALVHNAGFPIIGQLLTVKLRHWDLMFAVNVRAFLLLGRAAHAALGASQGAICAIASTAAEMVSPNLTGYSASKAALVMLANQMAYEWGPDGIRVNCVSPGMTYSRSTENVMSTPEQVNRRESIVPLRRLGQPQDIAAAVSFLVGPESTYVTGENVHVDGGIRHITMDNVSPRDAGYLKK